MCSTARPAHPMLRRSCSCTASRRRRGCGGRLSTGLPTATGWSLPTIPDSGHSDAPPAASFSYTFDNITDYVERFTDKIGLDRYSLVVQDYGGPVGMRLAMRRPDRLSGLVVHNAVCHEERLGPLWETRRAFWSDRARYEPALRENFFATRLRHGGNSPERDAYDPDLWTDEFAFLNRPGQRDIQTDLFYD